MKTIYLMRHGQTLFNVMDVNQGQCDSPLTQLGIQLAKNAGAWRLFPTSRRRIKASWATAASSSCTMKMETSPWNRL